MTLDKKGKVLESIKAIPYLLTTHPWRQSKSKSYENEENYGFARLIEIIEPYHLVNLNVSC